MFRGVVVGQGLGVGGSLWHGMLLSAPLLQRTKSLWEARIIPHGAAGLSRGRSPAAVQPVQTFRSDSGYV